MTKIPLTAPPLKLDPNAGLVVAFSGGLDSTVLLHRLATDNNWRARLRVVVHVNHGIHPDAASWQDQCESVCSAMQLPYLGISVQMPTVMDSSLEASARAARYRVLIQCMKRGEVLATAHHRDDQVETVLLKLLRGAGDSGLAGMRVWRDLGMDEVSLNNTPDFHGFLWRPLLQVPRADLLQYAQSQGLRWINDPSNESLHHDRNFLRHDILPRLRQRFEGADAAIAHSARLLAHTGMHTQARAAQTLARARTLDSRVLRLDALSPLNPIDLGEVIRAWCGKTLCPIPPHTILTQLHTSLLTAREDAMPLLEWSNWQLRRHQDLLYLLPKPVHIDPHWTSTLHCELPLNLPAELGTLNLRSEFKDKPTALFLDQHVFMVRFRVGGEKIKLAPDRPSQSLKNLLHDAGVPVWQRERVPLVCMGDRVLAVGDYFFEAEWNSWLQNNGLRLQWDRQ